MGDFTANQPISLQLIITAHQTAFSDDRDIHMDLKQWAKKKMHRGNFQLKQHYVPYFETSENKSNQPINAINGSFKDVYTARSRPVLSVSDHSVIYLLPKQLIGRIRSRQSRIC